MPAASRDTAHTSVKALIERLRARTIGGTQYARGHSQPMDEMLSDIASELLPLGDLSLFALGGYGREELCPFSDIDLMFLTHAQTGEDAQQSIEKFLYALWDRGLKVGHSVRSLGQCAELARRDSKVMTSLLDARLIIGNEDLAGRLHREIRSLLPPAERRDFVDSKLAERDDRHLRFGDTRYVLEPNIKEGKGGLRDFQTMLWITHMLYDAPTLGDLAAASLLTPAEARRFARAHEFLLTVRCHLHDVAGRAEDRLHFDIQPDIASRLGYRDRVNARAVERFMKHYFLVTREIGDLTRILIAAIEHRDSDEKTTSFLGFEILDNRLMFSPARPLSSQPMEMLRIFKVFQDSGKDIHPAALKEITRNLRNIDARLRSNTQANQIFVDILCGKKSAALTLRKMNEAGVLGRFIPDFGRIVALMQFDRYHYFTVDEHILRCVDIAHQLCNGLLHDEAPLASDAAAAITDLTPLYVALFLHDIAKGRGGRHAELGAQIALELCPRFNLDGETTDLVSWLVHEHLLMSDTAFRRNLNDPKTIADFSARIRSRDRLDLLFCLTTADIMAVGPGRWTAWKARLLEELFIKTAMLMDGDEPGMTGEVSIPADLRDDETRIDITTDDTQSATVVRIYTPDRPGLFALLCGALSAEGTSIMRAYINTVPDRRIAVDRFVIQNSSGLPLAKNHRQDDIRDSIKAALAGTLDINTLIARHKQPLSRQDQVFDIPAVITLDNEASGTDTVVEIETRDRHGLLYDIACCLRDEGFDMRAAKINTQGLRAIDSFYIQTAKRRKLTDLKGQERLIAALKATVAKP